MSRPLPLLSVPTQAARILFLRAIYASGLVWCGFTVTQAQTAMTDLYDEMRFVYMTNLGGILFASAVDIEYMTKQAGLTFTPVNSATQFIRYGRMIEEEEPEAYWGDIYIDPNLGPIGAAPS